MDDFEEYSYLCFDSPTGEDSSKQKWGKKWYFSKEKKMLAQETNKQWFLGLSCTIILLVLMKDKEKKDPSFEYPTNNIYTICIFLPNIKV